MSARHCTFRGRAVEVRPVSARVLIEAAEAGQQSGNTADASWFMLTKAAFWHDTGEPVFPDFATHPLDITPASAGGELMEMARHCAELNKPETGAFPEPAKPNGHDAEAQALPSR